MTQFSTEDLARIEAMGKSAADVTAQIDIFRKGVEPAQLVRACTLNDGLRRLDDDADALLQRFKQACNQGRVTKFVPASGAASRMFKSLHEARTALAESRDPADSAVDTFFDNLTNFAFAPALAEKMGMKAADLPQAGRRDVLDALLGENGLNYSSSPKGLLLFHAYSDKPRTPVEEHLHEAVAYARAGNGSARLHFTVSPEHEAGFRQLVDDAGRHFEDTRFRVDYSVQAPSTDTIAVTPENEPFRIDGNLFFRPGGHGALIQNLNQLQGDLVFIKNIDNVVPDRLKGTTTRYKQLLGGHLLTLQDRVFDYLRQLKDGAPSRETLEEMEAFIHDNLGYHAGQPLVGDDHAKSAEALFRVLDRPLRVCGMVRNQGDPGGGPFWVKDADGNVSIQIVETSQIDTDNPEQAAILASSTHFNPVDLVCAVRDFEGKPFDLDQYIDHDACFIASKSKDGRDLRALELPGLWNGAMAGWNTAFVEVPVITFNPVKTVNDLLREEHR
ncbi:MAG: DUF4301 family protein [Acidobacteriota bacterium]|nr:DUF4301 family protein [Acidobacteriota bacterium]